MSCGSPGNATRFSTRRSPSGENYMQCDRNNDEKKIDSDVFNIAPKKTSVEQLRKWRVWEQDGYWEGNTGAVMNLDGDERYGMKPRWYAQGIFIIVGGSSSLGTSNDILVLKLCSVIRDFNGFDVSRYSSRYTNEDRGSIWLMHEVVSLWEVADLKFPNILVSEWSTLMEVHDEGQGKGGVGMKRANHEQLWAAQAAWMYKASILRETRDKIEAILERELWADLEMTNPVEEFLALEDWIID